MARNDPKAHGSYPIIGFLIVVNFFGALGAFTIGSWLIDASYAPNLSSLFLMLQHDDFPMAEEDRRDETSNLSLITNTFYVTGILTIIGGIVSFTWNLFDMLLILFCPNCWIGRNYLDLIRDDLAGGIESDENPQDEEH